MLFLQIRLSVPKINAVILNVIWMSVVAMIPEASVLKLLKETVIYELSNKPECLFSHVNSLRVTPGASPNVDMDFIVL